MSALTINVDLGNLDAYLDEKREAVEAAVRPAAQAAAQVLYDAVKVNVGALGRKTGNLDRSIYQAYSENNSGPAKATYHVSWNARKAPHGHLIEFGHIQRYASYIGKDGNWYTAVRPEMRGKPKPKRSAPQSVKDAYYVLRPGGPVQWLAKSFVRSAASRFPQAQAAARAKFFEVLDTK